MKTSKYIILKEFETNLIAIENAIGVNETDNYTLNSLAKYIFADKFKGVYSSDDKYNMKNALFQ